jgi:hypothetical protein
MEADLLNAYGSAMAIVARLFIDTADQADHDRLELPSRLGSRISAVRPTG